jgi:hypothetical protein
VGFSPRQKEDFLNFLRSIDREVGTKLPPKEAGDFLSVLTDYKVSDEDFKLKIAVISYKIPETLNELRSTIKNLSIVRQAMLDTASINAEECKEIALDFFNGRISEYLELSFYEDLEAEGDLNIAEKNRRKERTIQKRKAEKEIQRLQKEKQIMFALEKEERKKLKNQKQDEILKIQKSRQKQYDYEFEERKKRRKEIDEIISSLQKELQNQADKEAEERKEKRAEKVAVQIALSKEQQKLRDEQAEKRKEEKEKEAIFMRARQSELQAEQMRQIDERRRKKDSIPSHIIDLRNGEKI